MAHYYSVEGTAVQLDESRDDVGVRFSGESGPQHAEAAFRSLVRAAPRRALQPPAMRFGRFMLLHDRGASAAPVQTVVNAFSARQAAQVARTMPVFIERESQLKLVATEQILVRFKASAADASRRKLLDGLGLKPVRSSEFDQSRLIVVPSEVSRASRALDLANQLVEADDLVEFAAPNFLAQIRKSALDDPLYPKQWHLENTGQRRGVPMQDARLPGAWKLVRGGRRSIVIAIIDDGVDLEHPDLAANIWRNPKRGARDRHGRDFVDDSDPFNPRPKVFMAPFDNHNKNDIHGTPCAGVAAAVGNNGEGVVGAAFNCRLMSVKILAGPALAPHDRIADAIRYASQHADVLSCSWGAARHPDIESALRFATARGRGGRGSVVCAATGNERATRIGFPSSHTQVIAVGACNDRGVKSRYSNYGTGIDLVAPSDDDIEGPQGITTTDVSLRGKGYASGPYIPDFGGTSSATPLVAGIAALVLSANPKLEWDGVRDILTSTADKIDTARGAYRAGYSIKYGFGRVSAEAAVAKAKESARRGSARKSKRTGKTKRRR